jgi:hypothetical protein
MPSPVGPRRALIFDLDSLNQRERWATGWRQATAAPDDPAAELRQRPRLDGRGRMTAEGLQWFAGVLRTADVLSDRILVTDAQLLDGIFFQGLGIERVQHLLGRTDLDDPALTVVGRAASLEECLRQLAVGSGSAFTTFEYSIVSPVTTQSPALHERLRSLDAAAIATAPTSTVAAAVAHALGEAHGEAATERYFADLATSWQQWIDAERDGLVAYERYAAPDPGLWQDIGTQWVAPDGTGHSDAWRAVHANLAATPARSVARALLDDAERAGHLDSPAREELSQWWETLYMDLIARNNSADWIDIMGGTSAVARTPSATGAGTRVARLRGDAPRILGAMPPERYAVLRYEARGAVSAWRRDRTQQACDRIAFAIQSAGQEVDLGSQRRELLAGLAISLVSAIVIFVVGLFSSIPGIAWTIPLAVLALTLGTEVLKVLAPIREMRHSALESVIHLDPAGRARA